MALKGKIYSIARQHDDLNTNELFESMIDKSAAQDTIVMDGRNIAAGSIFAEQIHANAITADKIKAGEIQTDHMLAGTIDVDRLKTSQLILPGKNYGGVVINNNGLTMKSTGTAKLDIKLSSASGFNITDRFNNQLIDINPSTGNVIMQVNQMTIGGYSATTTKDIDDIEVGGRNLILGTSDDAHDGVTGNSVVTHAVRSGNMEFKANQVYTISLDFKAESGIKSFNYNYFWSQGHDTGGNAPLSGHLEIIDDGEWHRYTYSFKLSGDRYGYVGLALDSRSELVVSNKKYSFKRLKLEKGNKATDWAPAPEDVEKAYTDVAIAKANLAETQAKAHADGKVTAEEERAIADAEKKLTEAKTHANTQSGNAETNAKDYAKKQVDDLEIGGRNYTRNGNFATGDISNWSRNGSVSFVRVDGLNTARLTGTSNGFYAYPSDKTLTDVFTISFKAKSVGSSSQIRFGFLNSGNNASATVNINNSWSTYKHTTNRLSSNALYHFYATGNTGSGVYITDIQVQRGSKATGYIPAPEDVEDAYTAVAEAKANLAKTQAEAYADGVVDEEEKRAIKEAKDKLAEAKKHAENEAGTAETNAKDYAKKQVDAVEVGGRNLVLNTKGKLYRTFGTSATLSEVAGATRLTWTGAAQTSIGEKFSVPLIVGETYTLSFEARGTISTPLEAFILASSGGNLSITYALSDSTVTQTFRKYSATFKFTGNPSDRLFIGSRGPSGTWLEVKDSTVKLEKGNKATDWTEAPEDTQLDINKKTYNPVRYIRDWANGSTSNTTNHWYEIQAYANGENVARGKSVSGDSTSLVVTDGNTAGTYASGGRSLGYVQVDLGSVYYNVDSVKVWRYHNDGRRYHETKTEVSADGTNWVPIFDSFVEGEYPEASSGRKYPNTIAKSESLISGKESMTRLGDDTSRVTISGGNIKAGTISSENNYSRIDLDDGTFSFGNGRLVWNGSDMTVNGKISVTNINGKLTDSQISSASTWNAKETTTGAQQKATAAETAAKNHASKVSRLTVLDSSNKKFSNLAGLQNRTANVTGYLIIRTPITTPYMTKVKISGYNYLSNNTNIDLTVGFYAYTNSFLNHSFMSSGDFPIEDVHLARDSSGRAVIIIGKSNTNWKYPAINIDEAQIGYTNPPDSYLDGWSIEFSTDISAYTSQRVKINGGDVSLRIDSADNKAANAKSKTDAWSFNGTTMIDGTSIQTGTLTANKIETGVLKDLKNNTRFDLTNGTFNIGSKFRYDGSTLSVDADSINLKGKVTFTDFNPGLQSTVNSKVTQSDVDSSISDIEVGGRNLYPNTTNEQTEGTFAGWQLYLHDIPIGEDENLRAGDEITWSGVLSPDKENTGLMAHFITDTGGYIQRQTNYISGGEIGKVIGHTVVPGNVVSLRLALRHDSGSALSDTVRYKELKIEKGNKATDWTPAPEDVEDSIFDVDNKATDAKNKTDAWTYTGETSIDGGSIEADTITATQIAANSITADELNVDKISALTSKLGDVTAGTITSENGNIHIDLNEGFMNVAEGLFKIQGKDIADTEDLGQLEDKIDKEIEDREGFISYSNGIVTIGQKNSPTNIQIKNDRISFMQNGAEVAYITEQTMEITHGIFVETAKIGEHKQQTLSGGHTVFTWEG